MCIRPKEKDDWLVVPNLWGVCIGRPGIMKTPAIQEPLKPLKQLEIEAKAHFDKQSAAHAAMKIVAEQKKKVAEQEIRAATVSIVGAIQPGPLSVYLAAAARNGAGDDGLIQRFQLAVRPAISRDWINVDVWPDAAARNAAYAVYARLDKLDPENVGADVDTEADGIPYLRFSSTAQSAFNEWRAGLEGKIRCGATIPRSRVTWQSIGAWFLPLHSSFI